MARPAPRWIYLVSFCLAGVSLPSGAEIFRWVDESGKVQFSDRKPATAKAKVDSIEVRTNGKPATSTGKGFAGTPREPTKALKVFQGEGEARKLRLDKILVDLKDDNGGQQVVGRNYTGAGCNKEQGGGITLTSGRADLENSSMHQQFNKLLKDNGYAVIDNSDVLFAGQTKETAELEIGMVITQLEINRCRENPKNPEEKFAAHMTINWKVFDPLNRKIIYEVSTAGSEHTSYPDNQPDNLGQARLSAFRNATTNLLADEDFVKLLDRKSTPTAITPALPATPVSLALTYGTGAGDFVQAVETLKRGTVTIRSAGGHGSGFLIDKDGYVLTNAHVVGSAQEVLVLADTQQVSALVVNRDPKRDVALIKLASPLEASPLPIQSKRASTGQSLYIIGTPLDESLSHTVTSGIVSAERKLDDGQRYYQTDAAINPGNSGGPVFNRQGEVIGMTVLGLFTQGGASTNINFFIPIDEALGSLQLK